ncbi:MAG: anti-sigma factor [Chloroflexi bacterium]|nr:anti-sigma factor [Chloroflexota bacterium]
MDHDQTREQLELAAVEPGGIDRLIAGDTATAQAVAAHLAGCPDCTGELARLQRAVGVIGAAVRELPPPDLRERTLASVMALGRARGGPVPEAAPDAVPPRPMAPARVLPSRRAAIGWIAAIAAAIVLSVATTSILVGGRVDRQLADQADTIQTLQEVTTATLQVTGEPDAKHVALTGTSNPALVGSLVFSPSSAQLVVVATGLTQPPAGQEYRCWVERDGRRQRVGRMFFSGGLAYWIGPVPALSGVSSDARFGVSLVDASDTTIDSPPVLAGAL